MTIVDLFKSFPANQQASILFVAYMALFLPISLGIYLARLRKKAVPAKADGK